MSRPGALRALEYELYMHAVNTGGALSDALRPFMHDRFLSGSGYSSFTGAFFARHKAGEPRPPETWEVPCLPSSG